MLPQGNNAPSSVAVLPEALLTVVRHCCVLHFQTQGDWQINWLPDTYEKKAKSNATDSVGLAMVENKAEDNHVDLCVNFGR